MGEFRGGDIERPGAAMDDGPPSNLKIDNFFYQIVQSTPNFRSGLS